MGKRSKYIDETYLKLLVILSKSVKLGVGLIYLPLEAINISILIGYLISHLVQLSRQRARLSSLLIRVYQ